VPTPRARSQALDCDFRAGRAWGSGPRPIPDPEIESTVLVTAGSGYVGGRRYVISNASEIGDPPDHEPDKWYALPHHVLATTQPNKPWTSCTSRLPASVRT
jgi:hypothetical protein